jgi:hypothetical protein
LEWDEGRALEFGSSPLENKLIAIKSKARAGDVDQW